LIWNNFILKGKWVELFTFVYNTLVDPVESYR
jgi:hypothetical protein